MRLNTPCVLALSNVFARSSFLNMIKRLFDKFFKVLYSHKVTKKWLPSSIYLPIYWKERMPVWKSLDIQNPSALSEKQQWIKVHDHKQLYTLLADKNRSKFWLGERFGYSHIVENYACYKLSDSINLNNLPNQFVLKCNHDSGTVFICRDKSSGVFYDKHMQEFSFGDVKRRLDDALHVNYYYEKREWCYKNIKPCIIAEKLLVRKDGSLPNDYKLLFLDGVFQFVYVSFDREGVDDRCIFDREWRRLPFIWGDSHSFKDGINTSVVPKPLSFDEMLEYGSEIAKYYRCVRVDFFDVDGSLYFGEITQFHTAGFARFSPEEYDLIYGNKIDLKRQI